MKLMLYLKLVKAKLDSLIKMSLLVINKPIVDSLLVDKKTPQHIELLKNSKIHQKKLSKKLKENHSLKDMLSV